MFVATRAFIFFFLSAVIITVVNGCKPKTKDALTDEHIQMAMLVKGMDDSVKNTFLQSIHPKERKKVDIALKQYEHFTGTVEYQDVSLNLPIHTVVSMEDGVVRHQIGRYKNNNIATEYYKVENDQIIDSTRSYYFGGQLRSRYYNAVDKSKRVIEQYYQSGQIRNRSTDASMTTWFENGAQSGIYYFDNGKVIKRTLWHPNKKKKEESEWWNDQLNGIFREWDSLGNQTRNEHYVNGIIKK